MQTMRSVFLHLHGKILEIFLKKRLNFFFIEFRKRQKNIAFDFDSIVFTYFFLYPRYPPFGLLDFGENVLSRFDPDFGLVADLGEEVNLFFGEDDFACVAFGLYFGELDITVLFAPTPWDFGRLEYLDLDFGRKILALVLSNRGLEGTSMNRSTVLRAGIV